MIYLKPKSGFKGSHVYVSNGDWAFDHNGWIRENELLLKTQCVYEKAFPGWAYELIRIEYSASSLEEFCKTYNHRQPWQFPYLPWERAYNYLAGFKNTPPTN